MKLLSFLGKLQFNLQKVWLHPSVSWFVSIFAFEIGSDFGTVTRNKFLYICNCAFCFMQLFQLLVCKCLLEVLRAVHKGILGFWCKITLSVIIEFAICIYCTGRVLFWSYIFVFNYIFYLIIYFFVLAICIFLDASCFDYIFLYLIIYFILL